MWLKNQMIALCSIFGKCHMFNAEQKKPGTKEYIPCGLLYMKFTKRQNHFLVIAVRVLDAPGGWWLERVMKGLQRMCVSRSMCWSRGCALLGENSGSCTLRTGGPSACMFYFNKRFIKLKAKQKPCFQIRAWWANGRHRSTYTGRG